MNWEDDVDPLAALRDGDPGPFEAFVRAELPRFLGFFRRLGARQAEAEDLTQDLFVKLYEHSDGYVAQGRFGAFAFRIARNLWIDRGRRASVRPRAVPTGSGEGDDLLRRVPDAGAPSPGDALAGREEAGLLRAAIGRLPESHRLVFELGVVEGLAYRDIGAILDVPVGTVKSRMFHAVRKLRESLGQADPASAEERGEGDSELGAGTNRGKEGGAWA